jgi:hypothetical protein
MIETTQGRAKAQAVAPKKKGGRKKKPKRLKMVPLTGRVLPAYYEALLDVAKQHSAGRKPTASFALRLAIEALLERDAPSLWEKIKNSKK